MSNSLKTDETRRILKNSSPTEETLRLLSATAGGVTNNVFSTERIVQTPPIDLPEFLKPNTRLKMDGLKFLSHLPIESIPIAFLDPQYRGAGLPPVFNSTYFVYFSLVVVPKRFVC